MIGAQVLLIVSVQFWLREMFLDTQALSRNRGTYVDTQNWHDSGFLDDLDRLVRSLVQTGQIGQEKFVKSSIGLHYCVDLVEPIEMHIWNIQFGVRMRKLCLLENLHLSLTGQTGPGAVRPVDEPVRPV